MATTLTAASAGFPPILVTDLINAVKGRSAIVGLCNQSPMPFNGLRQYTFNADSEISVVGESGTKPASSLTLTPKTITPFKVVYQARVTDEFLRCSEELQISIMQSYTEAWAAKLAKGIDLMFIHGVDPYTNVLAPSSISSYFDGDVTGNIATWDSTGSATPDSAVEDAIGLIQANFYDPTGIALSPAFRKALADMTLQSGERFYPGLAWGAEQNSMNGVATRVGTAVGTMPTTTELKTDYAIVGDWNAFKWGFSSEIAMELIEYGDPDQTGVDLKAHNQVMIRSEAYLGGAILDPNAFAIIRAA